MKIALREAAAVQVQFQNFDWIPSPAVGNMTRCAPGGPETKSVQCHVSVGSSVAAGNWQSSSRAGRTRPKNPRNFQASVINRAVPVRPTVTSAGCSRVPRLEDVDWKPANRQLPLPSNRRAGLEVLGERDLSWKNRATMGASPAVIEVRVLLLP